MFFPLIYPYWLFWPLEAEVNPPFVDPNILNISTKNAVVAKTGPRFVFQSDLISRFNKLGTNGPHGGYDNIILFDANKMKTEQSDCRYSLWVAVAEIWNNISPIKAHNNPLGELHIIPHHLKHQY
jgi:hypothetical protein